MVEVGAYEAKTYLPKLLDRVCKGERIKITRHGLVVALLVPSSERSATLPRNDVVAQIHEFRRKRRLGKRSPKALKEMINEGHR